MFVAPFFADARVDQNSLAIRFDEEAIHIHANAILIVRRINAGPEVARHDSEHRAAIEPELTIGNDLNPVIAELHRESDSYFFPPLGAAGLGFAPGSLCGGPSCGIMPGIPCCICCGGGWETEKFSAIVMWLLWRFTISSIRFFSFSDSTASRAWSFGDFGGPKGFAAPAAIRIFRACNCSSGLPSFGLVFFSSTLMI